jgi:hypothetical protein
MISAAGASAAAAAAHRRKMQQEEEELTPYTEDDLDQGWEFKIVRSNLNAFGNPAKLRDLIEQERRAGWVMVEKFDDARIRFKRPASARQRDPSLPPGVDPYRTTYGMGQGQLAIVIIVITLLGTAFLLLLVFALTNPS